MENLKSLMRFQIALVLALTSIPTGAVPGANLHTQTASGANKPANPVRNNGVVRGSADNPMEYAEDYSVIVIGENDRIEAEIKEAEARGQTPNAFPQEGIGIENQIEMAAAANDNNDGGVALLLGDNNSGRNTTAREVILSNRHITYYRLRIDRLFGNDPKLTNEQRAEIIKGVILNLEAQNNNNTSGRVALLVDNVAAISDAPTVADVKPVAAILEAITIERNLPMLLIVDGATNKDVFIDKPAAYQKIKVVEMKPAQFEAVLYDLQRKRPDLEKRYGNIPITNEALVEAANISLSYNANAAYEAAENYVREAARAVYQQQNGFDTEVVALKKQRSQLRAELYSLQMDSRTGGIDEKSQERLAALPEELKKVEAKITDLSTPSARTEARLEAVKRQKEEAVRILDIMEGNIQGELPAEAVPEQKPQSTMEKIGSFVSGLLGGSSGTVAKPDPDAHLTPIERQTKKVSDLVNELRDLEAQNKEVTSDAAPTRVGAKQVDIVASRTLDVPTTSLNPNIDEAFTSISTIKEEVFNQDHIIDRIAEALGSYQIQREREEKAARLNGEEVKKKPIYSGLFAGRTGTGKTEIVKRLAKKMGIAPKKIVRFDMTEFMTPETVFRLIGAPPGHVGFEKGGELTEAIRHRPFNIILFDEVEKADPAVLKILMQVLDDARLTDSHGRTVDFSKTVIILTTNAGDYVGDLNKSQLIKEVNRIMGGKYTNAQLNEMSEQDLRLEIVKSVLRQKWSEAELARIDNLFVTNNHDPKTVQEIVHKLFKKLAGEFRDIDKVKLMISESAMEVIIGTFKPEEGARSLEHAFRQYVMDPLNLRAARGLMKKGDVVVIDFDGTNFDYLVRNEVNIKAALDEVKLTEHKNPVQTTAQEAVETTKTKKNAKVVKPVISRKFDEHYMLRDIVARIVKGQKVK